MKKYFFVLLSLLLVSNMFAFGLNNRYGIQAGLNITNIRLITMRDIYGTEDVLISYRPMKTYSFNVYFRLYQIGDFYITLEPGFIQKGAIEKIYGKTPESRNMLNYLQLPVLVNADLFEKVILSLGFEIDFLINARLRQINHSDSQVSYAYDYSRWNNSSALIGIGYKFNRLIDIGLRYNLGISSNSRSVWFSDPFGQPTGEMVVEKYQYSQFLLRIRF
jgi:hypothetical protein